MSNVSLWPSKIGILSMRRMIQASLTDAQALYELWSRRTEELEKVAEHEGFEEVTPALRYRS